MFKKKILNMSLDTQFKLFKARKDKLVFDVNAEPPTKEQIEDCLESLPNKTNLYAINNKFQKKFIGSGITIGVLISILGPLISFIMGKIFIADIIMIMFWSTPFSLLLAFGIMSFFINDDFYTDLLEEVIKENKQLSNIEENFYPDIVRICESSPTCMKYKDKVIKQGRTLLVTEYKMLEKQAEKDNKINAKEKFFNTNSNTKEMSYNL